MNRYSHDKRGVTLVELLVVIAIIGILTSAAIPVLSRLSGFASSKNQEATRDLYTILKAAQIYASTHNTDTAVIYIAREYTDSLDEGASPAATQYMVVRRIKNDELISLRRYQPAGTSNLAALVDGFAGDANGTLGNNLLDLITHESVTYFNGNLSQDYRDVFVPIRHADNLFREFPRDTCLLFRPDPERRGIDGEDLLQGSDATPDPFLNASKYHENTGLVPVFVFNPWIIDEFGEMSGEIFYPPSHASFSNPTNLLTYGDGTNQEPQWSVKFPGHVFKPNGEVRRNTSLDTKERITLHLGTIPDREPDDRFFEDPDKDESYNSADPYLRDNKNDPELLTLKSNLRLFVATGRVKIETEV